MRYVNYIVVGCVLFFFIPIVALAGSLDDPGAPTSAASAMYTLEDIYNRLNVGTAGAKRTGAFTEPSSGPAVTGHTTDDIMDKAPSVDDTHGAGVADVANGKTFWGLKSGEWGTKTGTGAIAAEPAPVAKTGQTTSGGTRDDGALQKGVAWPAPRFTDNSDGTVTDNLTGLIWLKNADCFSQRSWTNALSDCNGLASGTCGLTDSSGSGDWRLPNVKELLSLLDFGYNSPALSNAVGTGQWSSDNAFLTLQSNFYWSSTSCASYTGYAWGVRFDGGSVGANTYATTSFVWPVKGGH
jgi:hypothetical protein